MRIVIILNFFVVLTLVSCGKYEGQDDKKNAPGNGSNDDSRNPQRTAQNQNYPGKSVEEILRIKYKNAFLVCHLWVQKSKKINRSEVPVRTVRWNLIKNFSPTNEFDFKVSVSEHKARFSLDITSLEIIERLSMRNDRGLSVERKNSPVIEMVLTYESETKFGEGRQVISRSSSKDEKVIENFKSEVFNNSVSSQVYKKDKYVSSIDCSIETVGM